MMTTTSAYDAYREKLAELGIDAGEGDPALEIALDTCAARGPACRLIADDDDILALIQANSQAQADE